MRQFLGPARARGRGLTSLATLRSSSILTSLCEFILWLQGVWIDPSPPQARGDEHRESFALRQAHKSKISTVREVGKSPDGSRAGVASSTGEPTDGKKNPLRRSSRVVSRRDDG